jgi:hypothetical protein
MNGTATIIAWYHPQNESETNPVIRAEILIDETDFAKVSRHAWTLNVHHTKTGVLIYPRAKIGGVKIRLSRFLLNPPKGVQIDHVNGDPLDNRRENLRPATQSQNMANIGPRRSGFKGVHFEKDSQCWRAEISSQHKRTRLGRFATAIEAARAYDLAAQVIHGEFAWLNFPDESTLQNRRVTATRPDRPVLSTSSIRRR